MTKIYMQKCTIQIGIERGFTFCIYFYWHYLYTAEQLLLLSIHMAYIHCVIQLWNLYRSIALALPYIIFTSPSTGFSFFQMYYCCYILHLLVYYIPSTFLWFSFLIFVKVLEVMIASSYPHLLWEVHPNSPAVSGHLVHMNGTSKTVRSNTSHCFPVYLWLQSS